jgi:hypothetical protein
MSNSISTSGGVQHTDSDPECRARAYAYLVELIGARPESLTWDSTHCLQGHAHVGHRDLVVIAPRDATHRPIVMTEPGWDAVRRSIADQRTALIQAYAITDHASLVSVLESDELPMLGLAA